jgi:hypothetical protein
MKYDPLKIVLLAFLPLVLRTALWFAACKVRSIHIKFLSCIVLAGSAVLLSIIPIPLPHILSKALVLGIAMYLMTRYTEAEIWPDVILIPLIVELLSTSILEYILIPVFN